MIQFQEFLYNIKLLMYCVLYTVVCTPAPQYQERARLKKLMAQEETMVPNLFYNMKRALMPLMADETYTAMDNVTRLIEAVNNNPKIRSAAGEKRSAGKAALTGAAAAVDADTNADAQAAVLEDVSKRAKVDTTTTTTAAVTADEPMEEDGEGDDEAVPESRQQACGANGANGGYCPPCYELA